MSLVFDIGQGAGLSGATGIRPFLPPLLAGALARADTGIDFDGTSWSFLEGDPFLLGVLVLAVIVYAADRAGSAERVLAVGITVIGTVLGALLAAGSVAAGGDSALIGIAVGLLCALLARFTVGPLLDRARGRLDEGAAGLLVLYAEAAALALAAIAIFAEPVSFLAIVALLFLLVRGRAHTDRKYAGLRILR